MKTKGPNGHNFQDVRTKDPLLASGFRGRQWSGGGSIKDKKNQVKAWRWAIASWPGKLRLGICTGKEG